MIKIAGLSALLMCIAWANASSGERFGYSTSGPGYSEDDALDRFEVDEMYLPQLNIQLPELFEWSVADNAYYA